MKKSSKNAHKPQVLMIGPYPPPYGGVANAVQNLSEEPTLNQKYDIQIYRTGRTDDSTSSVMQAIKDLFQIKKFFLTVKKENFDIIHIHTASYWSFLRNTPYVLISRYLSAAQIIIHIHGGEFHDFYENASWLMKKIIKKTLTSATCLFVTAPSWITVIERIIGKNVRIYSIPNGYNEKIFFMSSQEKARDVLHLPKKNKILLTVGSLESHKGHTILIESLKEIHQSTDDIRTYIIGKGSALEHLQKLIHASNLEERVILAGGEKTPEEIALWMNAADVFVLPSLKEGNPTVMFECLGCGKPFLGTSVGGIPDIIISPEYGLLCKPGDSKDLTDKLLKVLQKEWDHEKIIKYAKDFTWTSIAKKIDEVYGKIIDGV